MTDKTCQPLVVDASALSHPDPKSRRADIPVAEMTVGSNQYYLENDNRSGEIVQRMTVRERMPTRVVISIENLTPVRLGYGGLPIYCVQEFRDLPLAKRSAEVKRNGDAKTERVSAPM